MYKPPAPTEIAELSKRMQEMKDNLRRMVEQSKHSDTVQNIEEVKEPILETAPVNFAGTLNLNQECTVPGEQVRTASEAECLTFRKHMGGDTLDAFAPLAHYTQRVHNGQMENTWVKISKTITLPDGTVLEGTTVKEKDYYVTEAAGLMTARVENPMAKRE